MKRKLLLLVIGVIVISALCSGAILSVLVHNRYVNNLNEQHKQDLKYISESYAILHERGSYVNDFHFVQSLAKQRKIRITLFNSDREVIADSENNSLILEEAQTFKELILNENKISHSSRQDEIGNFYSRFSAQRLQGNDTLIIRVSSSLEGMLRDITLIQEHYMVAIIVSIIVTIFIGFSIISIIMKPIFNLNKAAMLLASGDYSQRVNDYNDDEIGALATSFNKMSSAINDHVEALSEKNAYLDSVLTEIVSGVIAIDELEMTTVFNRAAESILSLDKGMVIGRSISDTPITPSIIDIINTVIESKESIVKEIIINNEQTIIVHCLPIREDLSHQIGVLCILFDETEKRKLEHLRKEFMTNVSHELRTPLTSINGFIETLAHYEQLDKEKMEKILFILTSEVDRLHSLINDMLRLSDIENLDRYTENHYLNIDKIMNESMKLLQPLAEQKNITIQYDNALTSYRLVGHVDWFTLMLNNLLSNAIKYGKENGYVKIHVEGIGSDIIIRVSDNGIGIPEDAQKDIFNRFYRVDKSRSRKEGGAGLGLSIAKGIVDGMGGKISLESEYGSGCEFTLVFKNDLSGSESMVLKE